MLLLRSVLFFFLLFLLDLRSDLALRSDLGLRLDLGFLEATLASTGSASVRSNGSGGA